MKEVDRILNGENIQEVLSDRFSCGIEAIEEDEVFEMAKLKKKRAKIYYWGNSRVNLFF